MTQAKIERGSPNLDGMDVGDLSVFWRKTVGQDRRKYAHQLFPTHRNARIVLQRLGDYASQKILAMKSRLAGNIQEALLRERMADCIYNQLPKWARW